MDPSHSASRFELVFHNITDLHTKPHNFIPFDGKQIEMDDFVYNYDEAKQKVRIGWYGDTGTAEPDPEMEFWADAIEFKTAP